MRSLSPPAPVLVMLLSAVAAFAATALTDIAPPAAASEPRITLLKPSIGEMRPGESRALALIIENRGAVADRLTGARSPRFDHLALLDRQGAPIEGLGVPPGQSRTLGPVGDAVLVIGLPKEAWLEGAAAELELEFERSGPIRLSLRAGARPSAGLKVTKSERTVGKQAAPRSDFDVSGDDKR